MEIQLQGKRLLLMGGGAFIKDIRSYANQKHFELVAVGYPRPGYAEQSEEYYPIDTKDIDKLSKLVKEKSIDGIFVGANETNILYAIQVAQKTGLRFYTTQTQWHVLSNKASFKQLLLKHGLPFIPEYEESDNIDTIAFPVIVKPVDGSGAKGISVCYDNKELSSAIQYAKNYSLSKKVIIEKFIQGMDDTFVRYNFQDGIYSVSSSFDKYSDFSEGGFTGMPLLYQHPSKHIEAYLERYDEKMQSLFNELQLKNGVMTLQGFVDKDDCFYFYEAGYRLGGSQSYLFTDAVNQSNSLHYMINYSLTGYMADYCIAKRDNPLFNKICCNQYVPLKGGIIAKIQGVDELNANQNILNITQMHNIGDTIYANGNLNQVCFRMHLIGDNIEAIDNTLKTIDETLKIIDTNGKDMIFKHYRGLSEVQTSAR